MILRSATVTAAAVSLLLTAGSPMVDAAADKVRFGEPVQVSADDSQAAAEPSIRAARDGTLYIAAPTGLGNFARDDSGAETSCGGPTTAASHGSSSGRSTRTSVVAMPT